MFQVLACNHTSVSVAKCFNFGARDLKRVTFLLIYKASGIWSNILGYYDPTLKLLKKKRKHEFCLVQWCNLLRIAGPLQSDLMIQPGTT